MNRTEKTTRQPLTFMPNRKYCCDRCSTHLWNHKLPPNGHELRCASWLPSNFCSEVRGPILHWRVWYVVWTGLRNACSVRREKRLSAAVSQLRTYMKGASEIDRLKSSFWYESEVQRAINETGPAALRQGGHFHCRQRSRNKKRPCAFMLAPAVFVRSWRTVVRARHR